MKFCNVKLLQNILSLIVNHPKPHSHTHPRNQSTDLSSMGRVCSFNSRPCNRCRAFPSVSACRSGRKSRAWPELSIIFNPDPLPAALNLKRGHICWPTPSPVPREFRRNPPDDSANIGAQIAISQNGACLLVHTHGGKFGRPLKQVRRRRARRGKIGGYVSMTTLDHVLRG